MALATLQPKKHLPCPHLKTARSGSYKKTCSTWSTSVNELPIPSQEYFHELLILERKRAERLKTSFVVMIIDLSGLHSQQNLTAIAVSLFTALRTTLRSTDIIGWYADGNSLGVVVTEYDNKSVDCILRKLSMKIREVLPDGQFSLVHFSHFVFPQIAATGTAGAIGLNSILYSNGTRTASPVPRFSHSLKRLLDITGSLLGIVLFSPLFLIIPLLIKWCGGGAVFFRQVRVGRFGEHFTLLKFRTMRESSSDSIHRDFIRQFIRESSAGSQTGTYKMKDDPRITRIGKYLRKTSLNELPQFFNVLLGNMSLVGPRPAIPYEVDEYDLWHRRRVLEVKPGITGFWQVKGRSKTDFETMVRMDLAYIKKWSPALDLKLILLTPLSLITAKGAY